MYNQKKMIDKQKSGIFYKMFLKILFIPLESIFFVFYHFFNINISVLKLQQLPKNKIIVYKIYIFSVWVLQYLSCFDFLFVWVS